MAVRAHSVCRRLRGRRTLSNSSGGYFFSGGGSYFTAARKRLPQCEASMRRTSSPERGPDAPEAQERPAKHGRIAGDAAAPAPCDDSGGAGFAPLPGVKPFERRHAVQGGGEHRVSGTHSAVLVLKVNGEPQRLPASVVNLRAQNNGHSGTHPRAQLSKLVPPALVATKAEEGLSAWKGADFLGIPISDGPVAHVMPEELGKWLDFVKGRAGVVGALDLRLLVLLASTWTVNATEDPPLKFTEDYIARVLKRYLNDRSTRPDKTMMVCLARPRVSAQLLTAQRCRPCGRHRCKPRSPRRRRRKRAGVPLPGAPARMVGSTLR